MESIFYTIFILIAFCSTAQILDRISLSSGGSATNEVSYVIGETFNFTMAEGDVVLETGSLGSEDDTGGDINYTQVQEIAFTSTIQYYPNPTSDYITFQDELFMDMVILLEVYNQSGQMVLRKPFNANQITIDVREIKGGQYYAVFKDQKLDIINAVKFVKN